MQSSMRSCAVSFMCCKGNTALLGQAEAAVTQEYRRLTQRALKRFYIGHGVYC